jgi:hypothetical protein
MIRVGSILWPDIVASEPLTVVSCVGAILVVAGSMTVALARSSKNSL